MNIQRVTLDEPRIRRMCLEKAAFLTKDEAKRNKHLVSKTRGMKLSVYHCVNCHCWHFTSATEQD